MPIDINRANLEKQKLALNTLTNLAKQFSQKPDSENLVNTALLALTGQFSITSSFALLNQSSGRKGGSSYFGTGRFRDKVLLASVLLTEEQIDYFIENPEPISIDDSDVDTRLSNLIYILSECDARLIIPLIHETNLIGIFGLGPKVTGRPFDQSDRDLLSAIIDAITPLIVNSLLFHEISDLSDWYLQILNNVKQGVFVFNKDNRLIKINNQGFNMLRAFKPHLKAIEVLNCAPMELVFPDGVFPGWQRQLAAVPSNSQPFYFEKMRAKDGRIERLYNVGVSVITDDSDRVADLIITIDDVTDQEESEQRLFELEKFAEKGMMASSISHELNNHLGLLMGGVELSQVALGKGNTDKAFNILGKLKENIDKMERFTAGLMDYARLETRKEVGNLNTIINDVLTFVASQKRFRSININTELLPSPLEFLIDADQMAQLLLNLLNNAADAIREAKPKSPQIIISTTIENNHACLAVKDNGIGIKPEIKDRLFKLHLTTKLDGHGYGLVTCGKIVKNHQGEIDIDSTEGKGTTLTFQFPITTEDKK
jgi:signal transduction histidine kinase